MVWSTGTVGQTVRAYVPATFGALIQLRDRGELAAVHVDGARAEPGVVAGDPAGPELEWYDVSELAQLLSPA